MFSIFIFAKTKKDFVEETERKSREIFKNKNFPQFRGGRSLKS
jgi:hypothetical protein